jgi:hypothetical protein
MFTWFGTKNKYTMQHLRMLHQTLVKYREINAANEPQMIEMLRTLAELIIYGDKHNDQFFEFFCEKNMLSLLMLICKQDSKTVQVQIIQTVSIMVQNIGNETALYYLLSNNHINELISYPYDFEMEELRDWYASFLKTLSLRLNESTIQFFFNERTQKFPLYLRALNFVHHREGMVRIAMRTLTLNVYKVPDAPMRKFILNPENIKYFDTLISTLLDQCLNQLVPMIKRSTVKNNGRLEEKINELVDFFYYLGDILGAGIPELSVKLTEQLLNYLVRPLMADGILKMGPIVQACDGMDEGLPVNLSLYLLTQIMIVTHHPPMLTEAVTVLMVPERPPPLSFEAGGSGNDKVQGATGAAVFEDDDELADLAAPVSTATLAAKAPRPPQQAADIEFHSDTEEAEEEPVATSGSVETLSSAMETLNTEGGGHVRKGSHALDAVGEGGDSNPYRNVLLGFLSNEDERLVLGGMTFLYAVMTNSEVDRSLLEVAHMCPQRHLKTKRLLDNLTTSPVSIPGPGGSEKEKSKLFGDDEGEEGAGEAVGADVTAKSMSPTDQQSLWEGGKAATAAEEELGRDGGQGAGEGGGNGAEASADGGADVADGGAESDDLINGEGALEYSESLVTDLFNVLSRKPVPRLITIQVCVKLLLELVYHEHQTRPCLTDLHFDMLAQAYAQAARAMLDRLHGPLGDLFLNLFEDEARRIHQLEFNDLEGLATNPLLLLPIASHANSGVKLEYRLPSGEVRVCSYSNACAYAATAMRVHLHKYVYAFTAIRACIYTIRREQYQLRFPPPHHSYDFPHSSWPSLS